MAAALRLGRRGLGRTWPNPSVGCLLVKDGVVVGRGVTAPGGRPHAETEALAEAGAAARGATAYVTLEPCSHVGRTGPCADALAAAGIARVVAAVRDPDPRVAGRGFNKLRAAGVEVLEGVLAETAARDHAGHVARVAHGRPAISLKLALSADGKLGRPGERVAITGEAANARVHMLRAMHDAILVGAGTALADDPLLTVRLPGLEARSPVRVVFDSELRLPPGAKLALTARATPTHVVCAFGAAAERAVALEAAGVVVHRVPPSLYTSPGVNLPIALRTLVKLGLTRVLAEGGPALARSLLDGGAIDEVVLFESPEPIGETGLAAPLALIEERFAPESSTMLGRDRMTIYRPRS
jgi:diaminohydroxyphosphoribosylaminopyrimidine deaminase/5-amino-6-(5-phosphoribosylamino)uracil reductase